MIEIRNISKTYSGEVQALRGVDLKIEAGVTQSLVGESGCGKSTLAKILLGLEKPTGGEILIDGKDLVGMPAIERAKIVQMIFQDTGSALNPRKKIGDIIAEPLKIQGASRSVIQDKVLKAMDSVGLHPEMIERFPHMFSGGQKQRIGIARALVTEPRYIVCDEPVSALDVSVQAQVLNLLSQLQKSRGIGFLFISHDLSVVKFLSRRLAVMYLGKIVEESEVDLLFKRPRHPYTQKLLMSLPSMSRKAISFEPESLELPSPLNPPPGCSFHPRCPYKVARCTSEVPQLMESGGSQVACHRADELDLSVGLD